MNTTVPDPAGGPAAGAVRPFGDRALLVSTADVGGAHALAAALQDRIDAGRAPPGIDEVVVGFATVLVVLDADLEVALAAAVAEWVADTGIDGSAPAEDAPPGRTHVLPVVFDGPDLAAVADTVGLSVERVVELMVSAEFEVAFVGFAPGFPYLCGLPADLRVLPRRSTPRTSVPAGSVAVAGGFASVYPRATPGGWHLLGRTSETLFDAHVPPHSRVAPGDRVLFTTVDSGALPRPVDDEVGRALLDADGPCLFVVEAGLATTVQDSGRRGCAHMGVPAAGAADQRSLALANLLVGNPAGAAALECTATGPTLEVVGDGHVAVVGRDSGSVDVTVDGHPVPDGTVLPVSDGQRVRIGRIRPGLRAYLAVSGGLATPELFGSRASDALAGLGPGLLQPGDRLARGTPGRARGRLAAAEPSPVGPTVLRVVAGPHGSAADGLAGTTWRVGPGVDRVGVRLDGGRGARPDAGGPPTSTPMVTGAVQVPPDGRPIVLLADHATVGGYPVVACVITADLPRLGQLVPGDEVTFVEVDVPTARDLRSEADRTDSARVTGWFPTVAAT